MNAEAINTSGKIVILRYIKYHRYDKSILAVLDADFPPLPSLAFIPRSAGTFGAFGRGWPLNAAAINAAEAL